VTPRIFGIPSNISPKPVKLESSILADSFILSFPRSLKYNISEMGRGLGPYGNFVISWTISQKSVMLETSNLVHRFLSSLPTRLKYNIPETGHCLFHVTPRKFDISSTVYPKSIKL